MNAANRNVPRLVLLGPAPAVAMVVVTVGRRWALVQPGPAWAPSVQYGAAWTSDPAALAVARGLARSLARDGFARLTLPQLALISHP